MFESTWNLPAPPEVVFATLERLDIYPTWWPQVRRADRIDDDTCDVVVRSTLPFRLRLTAHRVNADPERGVLQARLSGDLVGFTGWTLAGTPGGTRAAFHQEVEASRPLLRRLEVARPILRANHAWMMRCGERGLNAHLVTAKS